MMDEFDCFSEDTMDIDALYGNNNNNNNTAETLPPDATKESIKTYKGKGKGKGKKSRPLEEDMTKELNANAECDLTPQPRIPGYRKRLINAESVKSLIQEGKQGILECGQLNLGMRQLMESPVVDNMENIVQDKRARKMGATEPPNSPKTAKDQQSEEENSETEDREVSEVVTEQEAANFAHREFSSMIDCPSMYQCKDMLGSFVCVVSNFEENTYDFKVYMIPGPYTDDPVTLTMLMKLFNPLYHQQDPNLSKEEAAYKKATMMVAANATEYYGPQIVDSCIAVWLSYRPRNSNLRITKSDMITKLKNMTISGPVEEEGLVELAKDYNSATHSRQSDDTSLSGSEDLTIATRRINLSTTTKYGHFLTCIFGYNRALYPDPRVISAPQFIHPTFDFIREVYIKQEQLYNLLADIRPPCKQLLCNRMKG